MTVHVFSVQNGEDPDVFPCDFEHDPIVTDPELPVAAKRTAQRHAEALWACSQPRLDQSADPATGFGRDLPKVVRAHRRVIAEGVRHSAFVDATPSPDFIVRERRGAIERPLPLLPDLRQSQILVRLERVTKKIACLRRERSALSAREPPERVIKGPLQDDIDSRVLGGHETKCITSDAPNRLAALVHFPLPRWLGRTAAPMERTRAALAY